VRTAKVDTMRTEDLATLDLHARRMPRSAALGTHRPLARPWERVQDVVPGFAHEVNNALNAVVGYADLLAQDLQSTTDVEVARDIGEAATRAVHLVRQLRALGAPPTEARPEWRAAPEAVELSARILRYLTPRRTRVSVATADAEHVMVDVRLLDRIFALVGSTLATVVDDPNLGPSGELQVSARWLYGVYRPKLEVVIVAIGELGVPSTVYDDEDLMAADALIAREGGELTLEAKLEGGMLVRFQIPARDAERLV